MKSKNYEKLKEFLKKKEANKIKHKNGTLEEHLLRTFELLEKKNYSEHVCFGGGLHSTFGTSSFKTKLLNNEEFFEIEKEFGKKTAKLVFLFSSIYR
jgi:hypothetical protein